MSTLLPRALRRLAHRLSPPLALLGALLIAGCGSAAKTTLPTAWSANVRDATTVYVEPNREDVVLAEEKNLTVLDGETGERLYGERERLSLGRLVRESVSVGNISLASMSAKGFSFAFLDEQGVVLVFDYNESEDIIRAIDLETGTERWRQEGYRWSLQKYQAVGAELAMVALLNVGVGAAVATSAVAAEVTRQRYTQLLVTPLPGQDAVMLKTVGALKGVDLATGEEQWSIEGIDGSSLRHTAALPGGDVLLVVNYASILEGLSGGKEMLRIDPEAGEVVWRTPYSESARDVREVRVLGEHAFLVHEDGEIEGFDIESGTRTLKTGTGFGRIRPVPATWSDKDDQQGGGGTGLRVQEVGPEDRDATVYLTSVPVVEDGTVYAPRGPNVRAAGRPDMAVRAYDVASGEVRWTSDPLERFDDLRDLTRTGDLILGRAVHYGSGTLGKSDPHQRVAAWRVRDGSLVWDLEMPHKGNAAVVTRELLSESRPERLNLVLDGDRVFTTSDTSVVALDVASGEVRAAGSLPEDALGPPALLMDRGDALAIVHDEGMSFVVKDSLAAGPVAQIAFENPIVSIREEDGHLFVAAQNNLRSSKKGLYVIDLAGRRLLGTLNLEDATRRAGNLLDGFVVTADGRALYTLSENGTLTKYRVR
jgi:outer membrane protein assembly factor BamB